MKTRSDFVTNSSSSSFIIEKKNLDEDQLKAIRMHYILGTKLNIPYADTDYWDLSENNKYISGYTDVDNFSFEEFFEKIGVPEHVIFWDDIPFDLDHVYGEFGTLKPKGEDPNWRNILHKEIED